MKNDIELKQIKSLVELLQLRSRYQPDRIAYSFLENGETESARLTYKELDARATAIAAQLQAVGATGERALLLYPPGLDFITGFFGCLYAGVVAVPAYPPRPNQSISRLQDIMQDARAKVMLSTTSLLDDIKRRFGEKYVELTPPSILATDNIISIQTSTWQPSIISSDTLALLQYTSGSTGAPKGVMVTHGNLLHNSALIAHCFQDTPDSLGVSWLPLYHDLGLIGGVLQPLYVGAKMMLMSPVAFLMKPYRWLQIISQHKVTTSGAPNFAYDYCVRKITPEQIQTLNLSSWEVAFNGAEPVRAETLERFAKSFAACGFRPEAFYPCYGMAEATLFITGGLKSSPPVIRHLCAAALAENRVVEPAITSNEKRAIVSCGYTSLGQEVAIAEPETCTPRLEGEIGEIWVKGASVAQGYWNQPNATKQTFQAYLTTGEGPFLRTGDLGFLQGEELFVIGRIKDLIIIRGRNHYPQDLELTAEKSHPALRPASSAAFTVEVNNEEQLILVAEVERTYLRKLDVKEVIGNIRQAIAAEHDLQVYKVILIKPGSIPKTSSGKIQRFACRSHFLDETLEIVA